MPVTGQSRVGCWEEGRKGGGGVVAWSRGGGANPRDSSFDGILEGAQV